MTSHNDRGNVELPATAASAATEPVEARDPQAGALLGDRYRLGPLLSETGRLASRWEFARVSTERRSKPGGSLVGLIAPAAVIVTACGPRPPGPDVYAQVHPFLYVGDSIKIERSATLPRDREITLTVRNSRTGGTWSQALPQGDSTSILEPITRDRLPDLPADLSVVETFAVEVRLSGSGSPYSSETTVIQDKEAALPPEIPTSLFVRGGPPIGGLWWEKSEPLPELMDPVAKNLAELWRGKNVKLENQQIEKAQLPSFGFASAYIAEMPDVELRRYTISADFPKHVLPANLIGSSKPIIGIPRQIEAFIPEAKKPGVIYYRVVKFDPISGGAKYATKPSSSRIE